MAAPRTALSADSLADEVKRLKDEIEQADKDRKKAANHAAEIRRVNTSKIKTLLAVIAMYDEGQMTVEELRPPEGTKRSRLPSWPTQPEQCFLSHAGGGKGLARYRGLCSYHMTRYNEGRLPKDMADEYMEKARDWAEKHHFKINDRGELIEEGITS